MPVDIEVDYSPALTDAELLLLKKIESIIAEPVWSLLSVSRTCWSPWQDELGRTLYVLTRWENQAEVLLHYNETELSSLTSEDAKTDIAFKRREQVQSGFSERTSR